MVPDEARWTGALKLINISGTTYALKIFCDIKLRVIDSTGDLYTYGVPLLYTPVRQTTHPAPAVNPNPTVAVGDQWLSRPTVVSKGPLDIALVPTGPKEVYGVYLTEA